MDNYFENANTTVTRKSYGTKIGKEYPKKIESKTRKNVNTEASCGDSDKAKKLEEMNKKVNTRKLEDLQKDRAYNKALTEGYDNLKDELVKDILRHVCIEALLVDEEPVIENLNIVVSLIDSQTDKVGGFKGIKAISESTGNPLLKKLINVCEATCKQVGERNLKEADCDASKLNFELSDEESKEFDYKKKDLGVEEIADFVKDKVLDVVKTEKKYNQDKTEVMEEIENQMQDLDDNTVQEAMSYIFSPKGAEEVTLFESFMRESYKTILENSSAAIFESKDEDDDDDDDDELELSELDTEDEIEDEDMEDDVDDDDIEDLMIEESAFSIGAKSLKQAFSVKDTVGSLTDYMKVYKKQMLELVDVADTKADMLYLKYLLKLFKSKFSPDRAAAKTVHKIQRRPEDYDAILDEVADAIDAKAKELGIPAKPNKRGAVKESVVYDNSINDIFMDYGASILEAVENKDSEKLADSLNKMGSKIEDVAEACKTKKAAKKCKESVREIQKSTEEIQESKCKQEELIVCPVCNQDPCVCENDPVMEAAVKDIFKKAVAKFKDTRDVKNKQFQRKRIVDSKRECLNELRKAETIDDFVKLLKALDTGIDELKANIELVDDPERVEMLDAYVDWLNGEFRQKIVSTLKSTHNAVYLNDGINVTEGAKLDNFRKNVQEFFENDLSKRIAKRDFAKVRTNLIRFVDSCKTEADIKYLKDDSKDGDEQLKRAKLRYPDSAEKIDEHIKWCETEYPKLLDKKLKEIKSKAVVESFSNRMDTVCDKLNNIIDRHEDALYEAQTSIMGEYDGQSVFVPLIQSSDCGLSNLQFAYKVKVACESLKARLYDVDDEVENKQLETMVDINIGSITEAQNIIADMDNMKYKYRILESAKNYLTKVNGATQALTESFAGIAEQEGSDYLTESVIQESVQQVYDVYESMKNESLIESVNNNHMEVVMAEAITKYTILEAFNTLNLIKLDPNEVRQMARKNIQ